MDRNEIKKENRKALKVYIPVVLGCAALGGLCGYFSNSDRAREIVQSLIQWLQNALFAAAPYLIIAVTAVTITVSVHQFITAKRLYTSADEDEDIEDGEDPYSRADATIARSVAAGSIGLITGMLFLGIIVSQIERYADQPRWLLLAAMAVYVAGMFLNIKMQQLQVDFLKQMSPHMKGSVYDMSFHKKWEESSDEAEKLIIYRASYKAFRTANTACCLIWVLLVLGALFFHYGSLPSIIVSVIWLILIVTYYREAMRLEHGKINR